MTDLDPLRGDLADSGYEPARYALSAVVYAERGDEVLLLQRAEGSALAGQWFLPGGLVEPGELPEEGARRELREEAGVEIEGELDIIGCYPMHVYGYDTLQISYRGPLAKASDMRALARSLNGFVRMADVSVHRSCEVQRATKYLAWGWWQMRAEVVCSGWYW